MQRSTAEYLSAFAPVADTIHCIQSLLWLAQAFVAGVQSTKSWQIALALAMPLFAKWAAAGCARGDAFRWRNMQCSMSETPLPHLLMWQMLFIAAATVFILAAGQGGSAQVCFLQYILFSCHCAYSAACSDASAAPAPVADIDDCCCNSLHASCIA